VKRPIVLGCAALCILLLAGCTSRRVLLSFERPYWESLGGGPRLAVALGAACAARGWLPSLHVGADRPVERLSVDVARGGWGAVVVGPPLSAEWRRYAPQNPRTRFILVDAPGAAAATDAPPNLTVLAFDRRAAFAAAGEAAGRVVRGDLPAAGTTALPEGEGAVGARVAVLLSPAPALEQPEVDAFGDGVARALDGSRPVVRGLADRVDKPAVKTLVEQLHRDGAEVFLLGMGALDAYALEVLEGAGGMAVVADWAASGAFPRQVLASVEVDLGGGIRRALAARPGTRQVNGPVRLVPGGARVLPAALLKEGLGR
jgi:hypothetical protein